MKNKWRFLTPLILVLALFTADFQVEAQSTASCTAITTLPSIIIRSDNYCLTGNLTATSNGIVILASDVVIDFNGYSIFGSRASTNIYFGIYANNQSNITVRNGEIVGFFYAIRIADSAYGRNTPYLTGRHTIENMEISHSTFRGIGIQGISNVIRNNTISHIQGNTLYENSFAMGIESTGQGVLIQDNFIYEVRGRGTADIGEGVGISVSGAGSGGTITDNIIVNISVNESFETNWHGLSESTFGIWVGGNSRVIISRNQIQNFMHGIALSSPTRASLIFDNLVLGAYSPIELNTNSHTTLNNICNRPCFETYDPSVVP